MRLLVFSDIHYASPAEKARQGFEQRVVEQLVLRLLLYAYRHYIWLPDPTAHNHLLDQALEGCGDADLVVANGDYSCDSAFIGVADDAACESVHQVLERLRGRFGERLRVVLGDHELGKFSLLGGHGGLRLASWDRCTGRLGLAPFWQERKGDWVLLGLTSTLLALPVYEREALPGELDRWRQHRAVHLTAIREALAGLSARDRLVLFLHDPTALPFLAEDPALRARFAQLEATFIGHLHSPLVLWQAQHLAGMPTIGFLGNAVRRMSGALNRARAWKPFRLHLCPSLTGIELLKDGGYLELHLPSSRQQPLAVQRHRLPR